MLKIRSISPVKIAVLILSISLVLPATAQSRGGFLLTGADAAYAWFEANWYHADFGDCTGDLFIGYVKADRLLYFGQRGGPNPHSDVNVMFTGFCNGLPTFLEGVRQALDPPDGLDAVMVELESAYVDYKVRLGEWGSGAPVAVFEVYWTAFGDTRTETFHSPEGNSAHRTRNALVDVRFLNIGGSVVTLAPKEDETPIITHYNENNRGSGQ